jgi:hypothetical protein
VISHLTSGMSSGSYVWHPRRKSVVSLQSSRRGGIRKRSVALMLRRRKRRRRSSIFLKAWTRAPVLLPRKIMRCLVEIRSAPFSWLKRSILLIIRVCIFVASMMDYSLEARSVPFLRFRLRRRDVAWSHISRLILARKDRSSLRIRRAPLLKFRLHWSYIILSDFTPFGGVFLAASPAHFGESEVKVKVCFWLGNKRHTNKYRCVNWVLVDCR